MEVLRKKKREIARRSDGQGDGGVPVLLVPLRRWCGVVVVVVDAFVGLRSSCRPTPGLSVLMLETRSTLDPQEQAREREKEKEEYTVGRARRKRRSHAVMREIGIELERVKV
ncbi:unnamed protein product [Lasius platythorax]|uniref:Uncharacterized protein n=1 Tax=Lasius platythorax TaxID=488582 RepID=A0AAV2NES9_9HYME